MEGCCKSRKEYPAGTTIMRAKIREFDREHAFMLFSILDKAEGDKLTLADLTRHACESHPAGLKEWNDYVRTT